MILYDVDFLTMLTCGIHWQNLSFDLFTMSQFSHAPHTLARYNLYNTTCFTRVANNFNVISGGRDKDFTRLLPYILFDKDLVQGHQGRSTIAFYF